MVMNPRTHPRGAPPDFTLPSPNPNPLRMTDALWWLVCMRAALEPTVSRNGGTVAEKPGYHSWGSRLPDKGQGASKTDHSIRRAPDRVGPWWQSKCSAHDWTFVDAQRGDYRTIKKYTSRLVNAMRDPRDLRPDDVYAYTIGQIDDDRIVEGYNEYNDDDETGDESHLWHRHDAFRRNIIGSFAAMWKALTIDMGWTYTEWLQSTQEEDVALTNDEINEIAKRSADQVWTRLLLDPYENKEKQAGTYLRYATARGRVEGQLNEVQNQLTRIEAREIATEQTLTQFGAALAELVARPNGGGSAPVTIEIAVDALRTVLRQGVGE